MTTLDLDALINTSRLPRVKLAGREVIVYPLTGMAAHRIAVVQDADASGAAMLGALLEILGPLVPDLTKSERERLSVEQIAAIIQLSRGQITEVEQMIAAQVAKDAEPAGNGEAVGASS